MDTPIDLVIYQTTVEGLLILLIVGGIAGALASAVLGGFGFVGNLIVGVIGAFVGSWAFAQFGIGDGGLIWSIIAAFAGSIIILLLIGLLFGRD